VVRKVLQGLELRPGAPRHGRGPRRVRSALRRHRDPRGPERARRTRRRPRARARARSERQRRRALRRLGRCGPIPFRRRRRDPPPPSTCRSQRRHPRSRRRRPTRRRASLVPASPFPARRSRTHVAVDRRRPSASGCQYAAAVHARSGVASRTSRTARSSPAVAISAAARARASCSRRACWPAEMSWPMTSPTIRPSRPPNDETSTCQARVSRFRRTRDCDPARAPRLGLQQLVGGLVTGQQIRRGAADDRLIRPAGPSKGVPVTPRPTATACRTPARPARGAASPTALRRALGIDIRQRPAHASRRIDGT
jgi:hypothetical protein